MRSHQAHAAVAKAKREGLLIPGPCELSDETCHGRVEAHHDDYDKPLEVRWLCIHHHGIIHRGRTRTPNQNLTEKVKLRLDVALLNALRRLAESGDRTIAAEIRRALRAHVATGGTEA
jgi:hypothetical protein